MIRGKKRQLRGRSLFSTSEWEAIATALSLSPRECEVVQCIFDELAEDRIAALLGITTSTVHSYARRLYQKLDVRSRLGLVLRIFATDREIAG